MAFPNKVIETTADLRARAGKRVEDLKISLGMLKLAGRELNKVARRHASRFFEQNSSLVRDAGKDVSSLARATFSQLTDRPVTITRKTSRKPRRTAARAA
jgi:hypothetical protein